MELQQQFPGLRLEGGPYTPPAYVQYGIKAVRASQAMVAVVFFFGEQIFGALGRRRPEFMTDTQQNVLVSGGVFYGLNCIAQVLKAINAFEVIYNGQVLHSKLSSGKFPTPGEVSRKLQQLKSRER